MSKKKYPRTEWNSPEKIERELRRIMELERIEYLPPMKVIRKHSACYNQITKSFGGLKGFRERMGVPDMRTYMAQQVPHPCAVCGKTFVGRRGDRYCSITCRRTEERVCPACGKTFIGARKYCSDECLRPARQENGRATGRKRLEKRTAKTQKPEKKPDNRPTVYDGIHPSKAFAKVKETGLPYKEIQMMEHPIEPINTAPYAGMKTYAERMAELREP